MNPAPSVAFWFDTEDAAYPVIITRRKAAKRLAIRFDPVRHDIQVTVPPRTSQKLVQQGLRDHRGWLQSRIQQRLEPVSFDIGAMIPIEGQDRCLEHDNRARKDRPTGAWHLTETHLRLTGNPDHFARRCVDAIKALAKERARQYVDNYCQILGQKTGQITMRDTGSRWASCTARGDFNFSWRLIFAPIPVFDYVAAHETAHLIHRNHSSDFWQLVADICPDQQGARHWLKQNGHQLFRYGAVSLRQRR